RPRLARPRAQEGALQLHARRGARGRRACLVRRRARSQAYRGSAAYRESARRALEREFGIQAEAPYVVREAEAEAQRVGVEAEEADRAGGPQAESDLVFAVHLELAGLGVGEGELAVVRRRDHVGVEVRRAVPEVQAPRRPHVEADLERAYALLL